MPMTNIVSKVAGRIICQYIGSMQKYEKSCNVKTITDVSVQIERRCEGAAGVASEKQFVGGCRSVARPEFP